MTAETKTSLARVCAVMVPKEAYDIRIYRILGKPYLGYGKKEKLYKDSAWLPLPAGDWKILGELGHITEEQAALVVEYSEMADVDEECEGGFLCEKRGYWHHVTALDEIKCLTDSMEVYAVNPYGEEPILNQKTAQYEYERADLPFVNSQKKWQRAQSRTGRWIILYEPITKK